MQDEIPLKCGECKYGESYTENGTDYVLCSLSHQTALDLYSCAYCNRDISDLDICYNCCHYMGGSGWGTFCSGLYFHVGHFDDDICEEFKRKKVKK